MEGGRISKRIKVCKLVSITFFYKTISNRISIHLDLVSPVLLLGNASLVLEVGSNSELKGLPIGGPHQQFVFAATDIA